MAFEKTYSQQDVAEILAWSEGKQSEYAAESDRIVHAHSLGKHALKSVEAPDDPGIDEEELLARASDPKQSSKGVATAYFSATHAAKMTSTVLNTPCGQAALGELDRGANRVHLISTRVSDLEMPILLVKADGDSTRPNATIAHVFLEIVTGRLLILTSYPDVDSPLSPGESAYIAEFPMFDRERTFKVNGEGEPEITTGYNVNPDKRAATGKRLTTFRDQKLREFMKPIKKAAGQAGGAYKKTITPKGKLDKKQKKAIKTEVQQFVAEKEKSLLRGSYESEKKGVWKLVAVADEGSVSGV